MDIYVAFILVVIYKDIHIINSIGFTFLLRMQCACADSPFHPLSRCERTKVWIPRPISTWGSLSVLITGVSTSACDDAEELSPQDKSEPQ
jgi:hypothetical protein